MKKPKKAITILLCSLIILSGLVVALGNVTAESSVNDNLQNLKDAINARDKGLSWLKSSQLEDGSWNSDVGVTSLNLLALLNAGYNENDDTVSKAIYYIIQFIQPDGSISSGTYMNYYTTTAVMALSATHNSKYHKTIKNAAQFIMDIQLDEDTPNDVYRVSRDDWRYGGIGYGGDGRPDLSNTQFALMALHAAQSSISDLRIPKNVWENALVFIDRCHNNADYNDQDWASDSGRASYNDGGYVYSPTNSLAGGTKSYMSMTGAGIWSAILSGQKLTNGRIVSSLDWLSKHYTWDENVGLGQKALFYNYWTMARALTVAQIKEITTNDGIKHNWFDELTDKLVSLQTGDGYWVNTKSDWFWGDIPEVVTSFALLALETKVLSTTSKIVVGLHSDTSSGADVKVYSDNGLEVGEKSNNGDTQTVTISNANADALRIEVIGKKDSDFTLEVLGQDGEREVAKRTYTGSIDEGEHQEIELVVTAVEGPVSFFGGEELTTSVDGSTNSSSGSVMFSMAVVAVIIVIILLFIWAKKRRKEK